VFWLLVFPSGSIYARTRSRFGVYSETPETMQSVRKLQKISMIRMLGRIHLHRDNFNSSYLPFTGLHASSNPARMDSEKPHGISPTYNDFFMLVLLS
jgi:hypothetical protein